MTTEMELQMQDTPTGHGAVAPGRTLSTWQVFILICAANLLLLWAYNRMVLTDEVYSRILGDALGSDLEEYLGTVRRMEPVGYVTAPLFLFIRFAFVALFCQLLLLINLQEIPFRGLFRIAVIASIPIVIQMGIQIAYLAGLDPQTLTPADFRLVPGSLSSLFMDSADSATPLYSLLSLVGVFELAWAGLLAGGLATVGKVGSTLSVLVVAVVWTITTLAKWGLMLFYNAVNPI